jgi:hypothetical protein
MANLYSFGPGNIVIVPTSDNAGNLITTPTPIKVASLQSFSVDETSDEKLLYGQGKYAEDAADGKSKLTAKGTNARVQARLWHAVRYGQTLANGIDRMYIDTTGTAIPAAPGPYTITPTPPSSGTFVKDLGVAVLSNGVVMTRIASGTPTTGQYTVSSGVYTFAAADAGVTVLINYEYTATSTSAAILDIYNTPMGSSPRFELQFQTSYSGEFLTYIFPNVKCNKLSLATKLDDYTIPELDFTILPDQNTGKLMRIATSKM